MNPFTFSVNVDKHDRWNMPARFLSTLYNLGFGWKDLDELGAAKVVMELEDVFYGIENRTRCLE